MRQAIQTKFLGPTNHRGMRIKARCFGGTLVIPWDDALDTANNHARAAKALSDKLGWSEFNDLIGGTTKEGYVFVLVPKSKNV